MKKNIATITALIVNIIGIFVVFFFTNTAHAQTVITPYFVENTATDRTDFYFNWPSTEYIGQGYDFKQTSNSQDYDVVGSCNSPRNPRSATQDQFIAITDIWHDANLTCAFDGIFYIVIKFTTGTVAGEKFYIPYRYSHTIGEGVQSPDEITEFISTNYGEVSSIDFDTRFINAVATGTASTSIFIDVEYFIDTSEFSANTRPDIIQTIATLDDGLNTQAIDQHLILPLIDGTATKTISFDSNLKDGLWFATLTFRNLNSNSTTFANSAISVSFELLAGQVVSSSVDEIYTGQNISTTIEYQDCSFTNPFGCIVNALIYVFIPSSNSFEQFTEVWTEVRSKPPFGYVTAIIDQLDTVDDTGSTAFSVGTIPFQSIIFDPFKILLAAGLWFLYALFWFSRLTTREI